MSLRTMHLQDLNPHLLCVLCGGYLVDATTIVECLHSFCRSCIVKYLQTSFHCPVCDVEVHKTKPLLHIRPDRTLQDIVYKIVPGIYHEEVNRRKEFEASQKEQCESAPEEETNDNASKNPEKETEALPFEDPVCITLDYFRKTRNRMEKEIFPTRYLRCSSAVTVKVLKKFLIMKFAIPETHITEIIRSDEILDAHLTMKEVCRIYGLYSKPFVDLQYVFLEKNERGAAPLEKPKSLEVKRKRIKKRKGNKNLLKKCLSPDAPRRLKNKSAKKAALPSNQQPTENTGNGDTEPCQARSFENEMKENLVLSPIDLCANVKKEDLVPSQEPTFDKVNEVFSLPESVDQHETVDKTSDNLPIPFMDVETGMNENENEAPGLLKSTIKNLVDLDVAEPVLNPDTNGIDSSMLVTPAVNGLIHAPSDESDSTKGIDTSVPNYASDICLNHISAELGSSALLHGLLLESS